MTKASLRGTLSVSRTVNAVDVYKASTHAGVLTRTHGGCSFQYTPDYAASEASEPIAFSMPIRAEAYEVYGTNLHPFNGDMHAKNVSVRTIDGRTELTPAYDLLSTLPYRDRKLALTMEGRDERLTRKHFVNFGERIGLRQAAVHLMLDRLCERVARCLPNLDEIGLATKVLAHLRSVMQTRLKELGSAS